MQSLLDELDLIEHYQQPGKSHHLSVMTEKQRGLYEMMGVVAPTAYPIIVSKVQTLPKGR